MNKYIGCKIILAEPMNEISFLKKVRNQDVPKDQVEDRSGYKVVYPDGYVSWSPKEVFEAAYRLITEGEMKLLGQPEPETAH